MHGIYTKTSVYTYIYILFHTLKGGFLGDSDGKESAHNDGDLSSVPGSGRSSGEGNGNPPHILAWEIPWTEKFGGI